jgi:hypothetical protein
MKMKKLFQDNSFNTGFWSGLILFALFNFLSYISALHTYDTRPIKISGGGYEFGFPFTMYGISGGYPIVEAYSWSAITANILTTLVCSFVIGLVFKLIWSNVRKPRPF